MRLEVPLDSIKSIYAHEPITEILVQSLNPKTSLADVADDLTEIGYAREPARQR